MSALTTALSFHLQCDLSGELDAYQLNIADELWPDATPRQAAAWYLKAALLKKYNEHDQPSSGACDAALTKFLLANEQCERFVLCPGSTFCEELVTALRDELDAFWWVNGDTPLVSTFDQLHERGTLGTGASRAARDTSLYAKLWDSPLSYSHGSLPFIWETITSRDPRFFHAEQTRSKRYGFVQVGGNKLSFVNKNVHVARAIATEPSLNMYYQLGLADILASRLRIRYGIDISSQAEYNRELAYEGSVTGRLATIDMESASDLISLTMCRAVLPKGLMAFLTALRSPQVTLPSGDTLQMHSVSTMGNGFTFPLMTMILAACVTAVYRRLGIHLRRPDGRLNYSVFGDDIIVVTEAVRPLYMLVETLGFKINRGKSFVEGPFRESCGRDFYSGHAVRGVYIKRLKTVQDFTVAINALVRWSAVTGIRVPETVGFLVRASSKVGQLLYGPPDEADDACVHVPLTMGLGVRRLEHGLVGYKRFVSKAVVCTFDRDTDHLAVPDGSKYKPRWNPDGLHLAFLHGNIRSAWRKAKGDRHMVHTMSLSPNRPRYSAKPRVSASWDTLAPEHRAIGWRRWSDAATSCIPG